MGMPNKGYREIMRKQYIFDCCFSACYIALFIAGMVWIFWGTAA